MIYYVLEDGRILSDISLVPDDISYIEVDEYPSPVIEDGKISVVVGIQDGDLLWETRDIILPKIVEETTETKEPTQLDNIEESQNLILLAIAEQYESQKADILAVMEAQATLYEKFLDSVGGTE